MAIQDSALPPSLVAEISDMRRRLTALERKPESPSLGQHFGGASAFAVPVFGTGKNAGKWTTYARVSLSGIRFPKLTVDLRYAGAQLDRTPIEQAAIPRPRVRLTIDGYYTSDEFTITNPDSAAQEGRVKRFEFEHGVAYGWDGQYRELTLEVQASVELYPDFNLAKWPTPALSPFGWSAYFPRVWAPEFVAAHD
ncbi:hypothetical protein [Streptomyces luteireticuli]|uniref:Uncharacterized protein n=1 Tax=Streptomyces luteireticuli TaxID=173858 RepID=A0ABP3IWV6_9ACTN